MGCDGAKPETRVQKRQSTLWHPQEKNTQTIAVTHGRPIRQPSGPDRRKRGIGAVM
jgi:hypothetical protein